jgi:hypothetical protein
MKEGNETYSVDGADLYLPAVSFEIFLGNLSSSSLSARRAHLIRLFLSRSQDTEFRYQFRSYCIHFLDSHNEHSPLGIHFSVAYGVCHLRVSLHELPLEPAYIGCFCRYLQVHVHLHLHVFVRTLHSFFFLGSTMMDYQVTN